MKFVVLFVLCFAAFVTAQEDEMLSLDEVKNYLQRTEKEFGATCENHKEVCAKLMAEGLGDDLQDSDVKACVNLAKQYLCDGKKEGEAFADLYQQFIKTINDLDIYI